MESDPEPNGLTLAGMGGSVQHIDPVRSLDRSIYGRRSGDRAVLAVDREDRENGVADKLQDLAAVIADRICDTVGKLFEIPLESVAFNSICNQRQILQFAEQNDRMNVFAVSAFHLFIKNFLARASAKEGLHQCNGVPALGMNLIEPAEHW